MPLYRPWTELIRSQFMRLSGTDSERRLQEEIRGFLAVERPGAARLPRSLDDRIGALRAWQARCYEAGYVGRAWPLEFGGGGRPVAEQIVIDQELAAAGAPEFANIVGLDVLGPSLLRFGTDAQRSRYIPAILAAEEIWCQGFSEPDAGSDLASLRTRAEERGETFVISGQKTWVSWGQFARWCGVLARTHDAQPKHREISMLLVDMRSPGVELRPMTQITGHAEFCELFLDDVVVPKANLLGELGDGWKIAMHTLGHERRTAAAGQASHLAGPCRARGGRAQGRRPAPDRRSRGAGRPRPGTGRRRGPAAPRVPNRRRVRGRRSCRSRQLERQAAHGRGRAAAGGNRARDPRADARARRPRGGRRGRLLARDLPVLARRDRLRRHAADPAQHHRRSRPRPSTGVTRWIWSSATSRSGSANRSRRCWRAKPSPSGSGNASSTSGRSPSVETTGSARSSCALSRARWGRTWRPSRTSAAPRCGSRPNRSRPRSQTTPSRSRCSSRERAGRPRP